MFYFMYLEKQSLLIKWSMGHSWLRVAAVLLWGREMCSKEQCSSVENFQGRLNFKQQEKSYVLNNIHLFPKSIKKNNNLENSILIFSSFLEIILLRLL